MTVVWTSDAYASETDTFTTTWSGIQRIAADRARIVTSFPAALGSPPGGWTKGARYAINAGDSEPFGNPNAQRVEATASNTKFAPRLDQGTDIWFAWESGFADPSSDSTNGFRGHGGDWSVFMQIHQNAGLTTEPFGCCVVSNGSTPLSFETVSRGGVETSPTTIKKNGFGTFAYGWWRFKVYLFFGQATGRIKLWYKSPSANADSDPWVLGVDYTGPVGYNPDSTGRTTMYLKHGHYRGKDTNATVIYSAGFRAGSTEADVDTGGSGGTGGGATIPSLPSGKTRYGITTAGGGRNGMSADRKRLSKIHFDQTLNLDKMWLFIQSDTSGTQAFKSVIYDDDGGGGEPGTLLFSSAEVSKTGTFSATWQEVSASGIYTAGDYWVGTISGATANIVKYATDSVASALRFNTDTYSDGAASSAGAMSTDNLQLSMCVEGTASGGGGGGADTTAPTLTTATIDGQTVLLEYDEPLNTGSVPSGSDFSFVIAGGSATASGVSVSGSRVQMIVSPRAHATDTVTYSYTPGANPIKDISGNSAASLSGQAVTNETSFGQRSSGTRTGGPRAGAGTRTGTGGGGI